MTVVCVFICAEMTAMNEFGHLHAVTIKHICATNMDVLHLARIKGNREHLVAFIYATVIASRLFCMMFVSCVGLLVMDQMGTLESINGGLNSVTWNLYISFVHLNLYHSTDM